MGLLVHWLTLVVRVYPPADRGILFEPWRFTNPPQRGTDFLQDTRIGLGVARGVQHLQGPPAADGADCPCRVATDDGIVVSECLFQDGKPA